MILLLSIILVSCSKNDDVIPVSYQKGVEDSYSQTDAIRDFSSILSKAVVESESVRTFLKETALEEIDNDYDVFYPFAKTKQVDETNTFRDILLQLKQISGSSKKLFLC